MDIKKLPVTSEKRIQAAQQKTPISFLKSAFENYSILWWCDLWAHLWWYILYYGQKEMSRKIDGKFTERKRNISNLVHGIFTKLYVQSQSCLKHHAISIFSTIPLYHRQIPTSSPNFVQKKFNFSANKMQIQIKSGANSVQIKQKPISNSKSAFLYDSIYGRTLRTIQTHLWRYSLYYNKNEMSTKFNRNFPAILPKLFRRKQHFSDPIHGIFTISDKHIQSQRK